jgi:hypothetical protein
MDARRRSEIAARGRAILPGLQQAVVDSWLDLIPSSQSWRPEALHRAHIASNRAVEGLIDSFEQGDLDDRSWFELRQAVLPHGGLVASELLRAVTIVAVEVLAENLAEGTGITHDERWQLNQEASAFTQRVLGPEEDLEGNREHALLSELQRRGPDLR